MQGFSFSPAMSQQKLIPPLKQCLLAKFTAYTCHLNQFERSSVLEKLSFAPGWQNAIVKATKRNICGDTQRLVYYVTFVVKSSIG